MGRWTVGALRARVRAPRAAFWLVCGSFRAEKFMATKFDQYLQDNKIDPRRILAASSKLEQLRPEDRKIRLQKRATKGEKAAAPAAGEKPAKRRSGRKVTPRLLASISAGKPVSGPAKTRLLRALNAVLVQKKKTPVDLRALF